MDGRVVEFTPFAGHLKQKWDDFSMLFLAEITLSNLRTLFGTQLYSYFLKNALQMSNNRGGLQANASIDYLANKCASIKLMLAWQATLNRCSPFCALITNLHQIKLSSEAIAMTKDGLKRHYGCGKLPISSLYLLYLHANEDDAELTGGSTPLKLE